MSNILGEITHFLGQRTRKTMELHFLTQEILSFRNGEPSRQIHRTDRKLVVKKLADPTLGKITVVDNLLFKFSFRFAMPNNLLFYEGEMQHLQPPLSCGHLIIDPDAQSIMLAFEIEDPNSAPTLGIRHVYKNLMGVRFEG